MATQVVIGRILPSSFKSLARFSKVLTNSEKFSRVNYVIPSEVERGGRGR